MQNTHNSQNDFAVVDLFCGIGGLTRGLIDEGLKVSAGIDFDDSCRYAYKENNNTEFIHKNVIDLTAKELEECYPIGKRKILVGCAPCQPFSSHSYKIGTKKDIPTEDERWKLLYEFIRLIKETSPEIISMENVPQLRKHKVFQDFVDELVKNGYHLSDYTKAVYCPDYGIPQKRYRLVLLASRLGPIELIKPTYQKKDYITVEETIRKLPPLEHGAQLESDPLHRARKLTPLNLERIKAISEGQNWTYLDEKLISPCHKTEKGKTFTVAYGRMRWKDQAPTITTHCIGFSNGNFGHPDQDRAISLREAALLQSFPANYKFISDSSKMNIADLARHIGNAVPPKLGAAIGTSIIEHINSLANG